MISLHSGRDAGMISCIAWIEKRKQWLRCDFMQFYSDIQCIWFVIFHVECDRLEEIRTKSEWIKEEKGNKNRKGHGNCKPHFNRSGIPPEVPFPFHSAVFQSPLSSPHRHSMSLWKENMYVCACAAGLWGYDMAYRVNSDLPDTSYKVICLLHYTQYCLFKLTVSRGCVIHINNLLVIGRY